MREFALIGCGRAVVPYADALPRLESGRVTATVDIQPQRAAHTATTLGAAVAVNSLDELLATHGDTFEAVVINTPSDTHAGLISQAAAAGKHVLVAPPLALSGEDADGAVAACAQADVRLMVAEPLRFTPYLQTIKTGVASGNLGALGLLRIHHWEPLGAGSWSRWEFDVDRSGGPALHQAIQGIDAAHWLFEDMPTSVFATARRRADPALPVPDFLLIHLGFAGDGMALIDYAMTLPAGDAYTSIEAIGATGAAYADDHHNMQLLYTGGSPSAIKTGQGLEHLVAMFEEFAGAISDQREPAISGADGRAALTIAQAVGDSLDSGRAARWTGDQYELV